MSVIVGIAGGTGSGKTTLARKIREGVGDRSVLLSHDWYYKDQRHLSLEERRALNYDHPNALDNELLFHHLSELKANRRIQAPVYDFVSHCRLDETLEVPAQPIVVVEGILLFVLTEIRELFDVKIYVDTDADIRAFRRIRRDMRERGRDFRSIRHQYYTTVRPMHIEFVEPSKRFADIIIPEGGNNKIALDIVIERLKQVEKTPMAQRGPQVSEVDED
jgi:uridine kinase